MEIPSAPKARKAFICKTSTYKASAIQVKPSKEQDQDLSIEEDTARVEQNLGDSSDSQNHFTNFLE